ncbi:MAG TPA: hypothetical protein ENK18_03980 [Deltaproteobacteria bacterium]|nr:hypothetical protein [Deltaproteobacteria bacterium]
MYTAAHEGELTDAGRTVAADGLWQLSFPLDPATGQPRWRIYASDGKHATYGTKAWCEGASSVPCVEEDCGFEGGDPGVFARIPPVANAGEPDAPRLTELSRLGFPGEEAWVDQPFCGGQGRSWSCASPVVDKLTDDPFAP